MPPTHKRVIEVLTASAIGLAMLIVLGMTWDEGRMTPVRTNGVFTGLFGGFLLVMCEKHARRFHAWYRLLHGLAILLSPVGCLLLLPFSTAFASGYILGVMVMTPFGWAIWESAVSKSGEDPH